MLKKLTEGEGDGAGENTSERDKVTSLKKRKSRPAIRRFAIKWHRRIGLLSALLVLILSITGVILNRTVDWPLDCAAIWNINRAIYI